MDLVNRIFKESNVKMKVHIIIYGVLLVLLIITFKSRRGCIWFLVPALCFIISIYQLYEVAAVVGDANIRIGNAVSDPKKLCIITFAKFNIPTVIALLVVFLRRRFVKKGNH